VNDVFKKEDRQKSRVKRHLRVRKKISGTAQRPRLAVYRSEKNIYAQVIDDVTKITLVSASSIDKAFELKIGSNKEAAKLVGKMIAERALEKGIEEVVFDRGGYVYHGRVQNLAEGAREAGLKF
jgi:large subunit ribosomal protein L18